MIDMSSGKLYFNFKADGDESMSCCYFRLNFFDFLPALNSATLKTRMGTLISTRSSTYIFFSATKSERGSWYRAHLTPHSNSSPPSLTFPSNLSRIYNE